MVFGKAFQPSQETFCHQKLPLELMCQQLESAQPPLISSAEIDLECSEVLKPTLRKKKTIFLPLVS